MRYFSQVAVGLLGVLLVAAVPVPHQQEQSVRNDVSLDALEKRAIPSQSRDVVVHLMQKQRFN